MNQPLLDTGPLLHRVGIVGGGQLARMMAEVAPALGISVTVLVAPGMSSLAANT